MRKICAIHQPNFLPRLSTLAKIMSADVWVVLDDVQFCRRDYQNRARIAPPENSDAWTWLTLPVHLPEGQRTEIRRVELADPYLSAKRTIGVVTQHLRRSPRWSAVQSVLEPLTASLAHNKHLHEVAEVSTRILLDMVGWHGEIVRSSSFEVSQERSTRLVDLTEAVEADMYLCGTGGKRYLEESAFVRRGIGVEYFDSPHWIDSEAWQSHKSLSAICALSERSISLA
ncbi:MAG TPA: WbqC family protein [Terriglobales bacterium]|nr:WbqC family protein [Terriglobales bacterium]